MSTLRDLNALKTTKYHKFTPNQYMKQNPEANLLYEPEKQYKFAHKNNNLNPHSKNKEQLRLTPNKFMHKRGGSFGTPDIIQKRNSNIINPRLSIYNFTMKLDLNSQFKQSIKDDYIEFPSTQRKNKNNYVNVKQFQNSKREPLFIQPFTVRQPQNTKIGKNMFEVIMPIGKGGFGKVWKVYEKRTKRIYAMKEMSKIKVINKKSVTSVLNERNYLSQLNHSFLVNMVYAFEDRQNLYLIMDYLDGGDLRYHIGNKQFFNERETKFFIANIVLSLEYLHRNKIIHRDLKPENLVFDSSGYLRITDLGVSRQIRQDNHQDTSGTPGYMSPEVMMRRSHSYAVDYFALGVIAYELMLGKRPYVGANRKEIKEQIIARQASIKLDQLPFKWSPHSIDFINRLLLRNPDQRLGSNGIEQLKDHPWLADVQWQKLLNHKLKSPFKPLSIQQDYDNYKQQISEDTINDNADEINLFLRKAQTQELFSGYYYQKKTNEINIKKLTSFTTNHTEEGFSRK